MEQQNILPRYSGNNKRRGEKRREKRGGEKRERKSIENNKRNKNRGKQRLFPDIFHLYINEKRRKQYICITIYLFYALFSTAYCIINEHENKKNI